MAYKDEDKYGLRASDSGDNRINMLKALVSIAPGVGGAIASLMSDYLPSMKQERFISFVEELATQLEKLEEKINKDYINSESFALIFESALLEATRNYQKQKINFLKGIVINSLIQKDMREEKEYYLNIVNQLTNLQLSIMSFLYNPREYLNSIGKPLNALDGMDWRSMLIYLFPGLDFDIIESNFNTLNQLGLIKTNSGSFNTMTMSKGLGLVEGRINNFGIKFVKFCLEY